MDIKGCSTMDLTTLNCKYHMKNKKAGIIIKYFLKISWLIIILAPFTILLSGSLKVTESIYSIPYDWIPLNPSLGNYVYLLKDFAMYQYLMNSLFVTVGTILIQANVCALAGYAFSRLNFKGRDVIFLASMLVMMIPYTTMIVPLFVILNKIHWINTFKALIIPNALTYSYGVFIFMQFCKGIPSSIEESAYIDGAGYFKVYSKIMLPLLKPAFFSVMILGGIGAWNDFLAPVIFLNSTEKFTVQLVLRYFVGQFQSDYPKLLAAVAIATFPMVILYFILQRNIVGSYITSGVKG